MNNKDRKLIDEVKAELLKRKELNDCNERQSISFTSDSHEDPVNTVPSFTFTKPFVIESTDRKKLEGSVLDKYERDFAADPRFNAWRGDNGEVVVEPKTWTNSESKFFSLDQLKKKNCADENESEH